MGILYDTNILIFFVRSQNDNLRAFVNPDKQPEYISYVNMAELQSFAIQQNWQDNKLRRVAEILNSLNVVNIEDEAILNAYVTIDSFSQRKNAVIKSPFRTPRNMGKNDIWIAATAMALNFKLITTDADFDHLTMLTIDKYKPNALPQ